MLVNTLVAEQNGLVHIGQQHIRGQVVLVAERAPELHVHLLLTRVHQPAHRSHHSATARPLLCKVHTVYFTCVQYWTKLKDLNNDSNILYSYN